MAAAARNGLDFLPRGTTFDAMEAPHDRSLHDRPADNGMPDDGSPYGRPGPDRPLFEAELRPHRSLSPRGFMILMSVFGGVNFVAGTGFWLLGAWPVFGFLGLDVALLWLAFRYSYRQAQAREFIRLDDSGLTILRRDDRGRERVTKLQPYWLRVECRDDDEYAALSLCSHGRATEVGGFLSPDERRDLAAALRHALQQQRSPAGGLFPLGQT